MTYIKINHNLYPAEINGSTGGPSATTITDWSRPCFTLPSTSLFDPDTMQFIA